MSLFVLTAALLGSDGAPPIARTQSSAACYGGVQTFAAPQAATVQRETTVITRDVIQPPPIVLERRDVVVERSAASFAPVYAPPARLVAVDAFDAFDAHYACGRSSSARVAVDVFDSRSRSSRSGDCFERSGRTRVEVDVFDSRGGRSRGRSRSRESVNVPTTFADGRGGITINAGDRSRIKLRGIGRR